MMFFDEEIEQLNNEKTTPEEIEHQDLENCLYSIRQLKNWVCYRLKPKKDSDKNTKIPINPYTGNCASASDPNTWGSYEDALDASEKYNGIGFEFGADFQGYVGVDLDDVVQEDGKIKQFALDIVNLLDSYTEYSPSGKGLHIICKSDTAMKDWGYGEKVSHRNDKIGLEMYDSKRFFTLTGKMYKTRSICERTEQLKQIYRQYLNKSSSTSEIKTSLSSSSVPPTYNYDVNLSDEELWNKMFASKNGEKIRLLFNGNVSEYDNDDSRADLALCNYLAYWTNKDVMRIDRMFRQSKLMRDKWNNPAYRDRTIQAAIDQNISEISFSSQQPLNVHPQELPPTPLLIINDQFSEDVSVSDYLDNLFYEDVKNFNRTSRLKTGFSNLDAVTALYSGVYVLGAVPGFGKTTFVTQLADNLSASGNHVLLFSLEQNRSELVSKGISRLTVNNNNVGLTAIQVRQQKENSLVASAIEKYRALSKNEYFIGCERKSFDFNFIKSKVENYIMRKQVRPIVIIDYLQIIQPSNGCKVSTKDIIDNHVRELKKLQVDNDIVLILISSFNRSSYTVPIDYESFKETGSVEYTADVLWGLQLQIMKDKMFSNAKTTFSEKREKINEKKSQNPRKMELVCIKNRFGGNYSCLFDYYPQYDLFKASDVKNNNVTETSTQTVAHL